jgi:hypothetical protein
VHETRSETDLIDGTTVIGKGFSEDVEILHLEGVYTWDKSIRLTAKLPYVLDAEREILVDGQKVRQTDSGIGDLTLALPLKRYFNLNKKSGSWTLAPQVVVPLEDKDAYSIYDHEWGNGLAFGYESETFKHTFSAGVSVWYYYDEEPVELKASLDLGFNLRGLGSSGNLKLRTDLHHEDDNSLTLSTGPSLYWRFTDAIHGQLSWKHDLYDRQGTLDHGNGDSIKAGLAFVY